ncbi:MAG: glycosyltransferase family 2 protein [Spirosomataceae bacterium]
MKLVSIITVNFNQPEVTEALLQSIFDYEDYPNYEVIVVDNGSRKDYTKEWRNRYENVTFIRSESNLGFAGGNNLGLDYASGEYFFLINNDTEITTGLTRKLVATLEKYPDVAIVSPKLHYASQEHLIQYVGYTKMNFFTGRNRCIGQFEIDKGQYDQASATTGFAHGAAMMVRREAVEKVGRMNEGYFLYFEELDWCERMRRAGYQIYVNTLALIYHKESVSVGKNSPLKEYYMTRNRILFVRKYAQPFQFAVFVMYYLLIVSPRNILRYLIRSDFNLLKAFFKGVFWHFSHTKNSI